MSSGARIVVTSFASATSPKLAPWREHSARVAGVALALGDDRALRPAVWHLASSNHRMLARSVAVFGDAVEATDDAAERLAECSALESVLVRDRDGSALGWYLRSADGPVLACARWYSTDRDRRKSLEAALDSLVTATVAPLVRVSHPQLGVRTFR